MGFLDGFFFALGALMAQLIPSFVFIHIALQDMDWLCRKVAHFIADHATLAAVLSMPPFTRQIKEQEHIYGHVFQSIREAQKEAFLKLLDAK